MGLELSPFLLGSCLMEEELFPCKWRINPFLWSRGHKILAKVGSIKPHNITMFSSEGRNSGTPVSDKSKDQARLTFPTPSQQGSLVSASPWKVSPSRALRVGCSLDSESTSCISLGVQQLQHPAKIPSWESLAFLLDAQATIPVGRTTRWQAASVAPRPVWFHCLPWERAWVAWQCYAAFPGKFTKHVSFVLFPKWKSWRHCI